MRTYENSSENYMDYKGRFLDKARKALIDENGYFKEVYDIYFINDEPTQELWELYENQNYRYLDEKIQYLEQLA